MNLHDNDWIFVIARNLEKLGEAEFPIAHSPINPHQHPSFVRFGHFGNVWPNFWVPDGFWVAARVPDNRFITMAPPPGSSPVHAEGAVGCCHLTVLPHRGLGHLTSGGGVSPPASCSPDRGGLVGLALRVT